jgi:methylmalonyl-CoA mutase C-terminal domain/subunit
VVVGVGGAVGDGVVLAGVAPRVGGGGDDVVTSRFDRTSATRERRTHPITMARTVTTTLVTAATAPLPIAAVGLGRYVSFVNIPLCHNSSRPSVGFVRIKRPYGERSHMSTGQEQRTIRCLVAKVGLDGHDRGAHVIARAFRDAGFEVIYSGLHRAPEEIVQAAVQEDVDVLGISILSGAHNTLIPKVIEGLKEYGAFEDTLVIVGGIVPDDDRRELKEAGVAEVFGPGTPMSETIEFVREHVPDR